VKRKIREWIILAGSEPVALCVTAVLMYEEILEFGNATSRPTGLPTVSMT
jgi:hypothetical protein